MNPLYENEKLEITRCPGCGGDPIGMNTCCGDCWRNMPETLKSKMPTPVTTQDVSNNRAIVFEAMGSWGNTKGLIDEDPAETDVAFLIFATDPEVERFLFDKDQNALNERRLEMTRKAWNRGAQVDSFEGRRREAAEHRALEMGLLESFGFTRA